VILRNYGENLLGRIMAHDKSTTENHNEAGGNRRFRLPKLFADSDETAHDTEETAERIAQRASALGVKLPGPIEEEVIIAANRPYEGAPRASVLRMSPEDAAAEMNAQASSATSSLPTAPAPVESHNTTKEAPTKVPANAAQAAPVTAMPVVAAQAARILPMPPRDALEKTVSAKDSPLTVVTSAHDVVGMDVSGAVAPGALHLARLQRQRTPISLRLFRAKQPERLASQLMCRNEYSKQTAT
jgi:hypothetical protein